MLLTTALRRPGPVSDADRGPRARGREGGLDRARRLPAASPWPSCSSAFSLVKQLRKAQAAKDAGVYGDEPVAPEDGRGTTDDVRRLSAQARTQPDEAVPGRAVGLAAVLAGRRARRAPPVPHAAPRPRGPSRSATTSSAVISTRGSCGPPVPSTRLVESCATRRSVPPGRERLHRSPGGRAPLVGRQLEVGDDGQVVARPRPHVVASARTHRPVGDVAAAPPVAGPCRGRPARSRPRSPSQPRPASQIALRPSPAARSTRPARRQVGALGGHELVRLGRPHQLGRGVPLVPGLGVHGPIQAPSDRGCVPPEEVRPVPELLPRTARCRPSTRRGRSRRASRRRSRGSARRACSVLPGPWPARSAARTAPPAPTPSPRRPGTGSRRAPASRGRRARRRRS